MTRPANKTRGEASLLLEGGTVVLRPSFAALVAAEEELGPLFALVERAAAGNLKISEMVALFWHCRHDVDPEMTRDSFSGSVVTAGLSAMTPALKILLGQILIGQ